MAVDAATQALLHQWFPDLYGAPTGVTGAPDQAPPVSQINAPTSDSIVGNELSGRAGGGAFGGLAPDPGAPSGAFSDPGQGTTNGTASPGGGRSIGDRLSALGDRMAASAPGVGANMAGRAALGALGLTGPAAMAAMGAGKTIYDIAMAPDNLSLGQMAETFASNMDPTKGIANLGNFAYDNTIGALTDTRLGMRGLLEALGIGNPAVDARQEAAKSAIRDQLDQAAADPYAGDGPEGQGGAQSSSWGGESHASDTYGSEGHTGSNREATDADTHDTSEHDSNEGGYAHGGVTGQLLYHDPQATSAPTNRLATLMQLLQAQQQNQSPMMMQPRRGAF